MYNVRTLQYKLMSPALGNLITYFTSIYPIHTTSENKNYYTPLMDSKTQSQRVCGTCLKTPPRK